MEEIANVKQFKKELEELLNRYGWDSAIDMPDFLIASLVYSNLDNLRLAHEANVAWHENRELTRPNPEGLSVSDWKVRNKESL